MSHTAQFHGVKYVFDVASVPEDEPECEFALFHSPFQTNQTLRPACKDALGWVGDTLRFLLPMASSVSVSVTSTAFVPRVAIWQASPTEAEVATGTLSGSTASVTHVNRTGGAAEFYYILVTSSDGAGTGAYTVQATITNANAATVSDAKLSEPSRPPSRPSTGTSVRMPPMY